MEKSSKQEMREFAEMFSKGIVELSKVYALGDEDKIKKYLDEVDFDYSRRTPAVAMDSLRLSLIDDLETLESAYKIMYLEDLVL